MSENKLTIDYKAMWKIVGEQLEVVEAERDQYLNAYITENELAERLERERDEALARVGELEESVRIYNGSVYGEMQRDRDRYCTALEELCNEVRNAERELRTYCEDRNNEAFHNFNRAFGVVLTKYSTATTALAPSTSSESGDTVAECGEGEPPCGNPLCERGRILSSNEAGDEYLMRCPDCRKDGG